MRYFGQGLLGSPPLHPPFLGGQFVKLVNFTRFSLPLDFNGLCFVNVTCEIGGENGYSRLCPRIHSGTRSSTGQLAALKAAGATTIYREKISGTRADRPQLARLMKALKAGDVVTVTKLDRLGRSTRELLDLIDRISKAGAAFRSLGDPLWDTR